MVCSINIDETPLRPNVRPAKPKSKRGPVTFFVDIEAPNGRSVIRNLTRGVNDIDDDYTPTPQPPVDVSLETLLLSLSVSSTFYWDTPVAFDPITADFFLQQFEVGVGGNIDVPDLELSVDIETTAQATISRAPIVVDLTLPQVTTNKTITLGAIDVGLSLPDSQVVSDIYGDLAVVDLTLPALSTDKETSFDPISLTMSLPDSQVVSDIYGDLAVVDLSVAGTLDVGININLPASMESAQDDDTPSFDSSLLLDTYSSAAAAYSVRKLSSTYSGPCMKVRKDDGVDTGTDIGFDADGNLNITAIAAHCGTDNGYVVTWYDQSGNSRNATQTTTADQPQIYNGTAVLTRNGKPAAVFDGSSDYMDMPDSMLPSNINNCSVFTVQTNESSPNGATFNIGGYGSNDRWFQTIVVSNVEYFGYGSSFSAINMGAATTSQRLITAIAGSTQGNAQCFVNGTSQGSVALQSATPSSGSGELVRSAYLANGTFQEVIVYHSDESTNRTGIESKISTYYFGQDLLLDTYPSSAAAYSVRKLSKYYQGPCIKVRKDDGVDTGTDIGFDANGNLNIAAIEAHCGTDNGYVVTWYDQSGSGNDATQATAGNQPQIYNGSSVITDNNRPCLYFPTTQILSAAGAATVGNRSRSQWSVFSLEAGTNYAAPWSAGLRSQIQPPDSNLKPNLYVNRTGGSPSITAASGINLNQQYLRCDIADTVTAESFIDGSSVLSGSDNNSDWATSNLVVAQPGDRGPFKVSECILYESDQSTNRTGITSNINTYFSVYS